MVGAFFSRGALAVYSIFLSSLMTENDYANYGLIYTSALAVTAVASFSLGVPMRNNFVHLKKNKLLSGAYGLCLIFLFITSVSISLFLVTSSSYFIFLPLIVVLQGIIGLNDYYFSGLQRFKLYNKINFICGVLLLSLVFIFHQIKLDLKLLDSLIILTLYSWLCLSLQLYPIFKTGFIPNFKIKQITKFYKSYSNEISPLLFQSFFNLPIIAISLFILEFNTQNSLLIAIIVFSNQIVGLFNTFFNKILTVLLPILRNNLTSELKKFKAGVNKQIKVFICFSPLIFLCYKIIPFLLNALTPKFESFSFEISTYIILNLITYLYWYFQEVNILLKNNWMVFKLNVVWGLLTIIILIIQINYLGSQKFGLINYIFSVILSRVIPLGCLVYLFIKNTSSYEKNTI